MISKNKQTEMYCVLLMLRAKVEWPTKPDLTVHNLL